MPAPARKNVTESKDPDPDTNVVVPEHDNPPDDTTSAPEEPKEEEMNPAVVPEGWEAIPESEGGGIRPKTVPWAGYESA